MVCVIPICAKDAHLVLKNLLWCVEMEMKPMHAAILSHDSSFQVSEEIKQLCSKLFKNVDCIVYEEWTGEQNWPVPQNWAWQQTARRFNLKSKDSWLWWEADATPLRKDWLSQIEAAHVSGAKPFSGHIVPGMGHMTGVGVYPSWVAQYCKAPLLTSKTPFDVAGKDEIVSRNLCHPINELIQHRFEIMGNPPHFETDQDLKLITEEAVIFHRCKDGSLIDLLTKRPRTSAKKKKIGKSKGAVSNLATVVLNRRGAIGDVIMVKGVAEALARQGIVAKINCDPVISPLLGEWVNDNTTGTNVIDLDGAYESHPKIRTIPKQKIFADKVRKELAEKGIQIAPLCNLAPSLNVASEYIVSRARSWPIRLIGISPRSNSWPQRTVQRSVWEKLGECGFVWLGTDPAPKGFYPHEAKSLKDFSALMSILDLVVTVDTGPMHIAAALGVKVLAIEQACSPELHLSDQRDFDVIGADLACLNCHEKKCPINKDMPPCGLISPEKINAAIERAMLSKRSQHVSAIIPVYKPDVERLNRCLSAVLPQVNEVVIGIDGDGIVPFGIIQDRKIIYARNPTGIRRGFGKTCNHAARKSCGKFLLMLNDDCFLAPGSVAALTSTMGKGVAVNSCLLRYENGLIQHGGGVRRPLDVGWGHLDHKRKQGSIKGVTIMENVTHACALIRRDAFYSVLGYDEEFDCYCEDNDFNLRVRQAGWKVQYNPNAQAIHAESQTTSAMKEQLSMEGSKIFQRKWRWYFEKNKDNQMGDFN